MQLLYIHLSTTMFLEVDVGMELEIGCLVLFSPRLDVGVAFGGVVK